MKFVVEFERNYKALYPAQLYNKELLTFICGDFNSSNHEGSELYAYLFNECIIDGVKINEHFVIHTDRNEK